MIPIHQRNVRIHAYNRSWLWPNICIMNIVFKVTYDQYFVFNLVFNRDNRIYI